MASYSRFGHNSTPASAACDGSSKKGNRRRGAMLLGLRTRQATASGFCGCNESKPKFSGKVAVCDVTFMMEYIFVQL